MTLSVARGMMTLSHSRLRALLIVLAIGRPLQGSAQVLTSSEARDSSRAALVRDVTYLASRNLAGRATGSRGSDSAVAYLVKTYVTTQIDPGVRTRQCDSTGACRYTYFQAFKPPAALLAAAGIEPTALAYNVVASVRGTDSSAANEWVVVGAHYDHLGETGYGALDDRTASMPHLGADDNASGTAGVLELARRFAAAPPRRSVMFVHFAAEELGLLGSKVFVAAPPTSPMPIVAMVNLDMVGRLSKGRLQLFGLETWRQWGRFVDAANATDRMPLERDRNPGPIGASSDHVSFYRFGIPAVHLFTGLHAQYHTKDDTAERIDFEGLLRIVDFSERMVRLIADDPAVLIRSPR